MIKVIKKCIKCKKEKIHYAKDLCSACYQHEWRKKNSELDKANTKRWRVNHPNDVKNWREENPEKHKKNQQRFKEKNPTYHNIYQNKRMRTDIKFKIRHDLATQIGKLIKESNGKKSHNTIKLLGCSIQELIEHLNKTGSEGITVKDIGQYKYHVDHIIPCASFDLTKEEDQLKCFHYTNLQLLWWEDNLSKGAKVL